MPLEKEILETLVEIKNLLTPKHGDSRFFDNGDETVSDKKTGLMWVKESSGERMSWSKAEEFCEKMNLAGHKDWRLPTVEELLTLVDYSRVEPAINSAFKAEQAYHWTSTPYAGSADYYWMVSFYGGYADWNVQDGDGFVRPVRQY